MKGHREVLEPRGAFLHTFPTTMSLSVSLLTSPVLYSLLGKASAYLANSPAHAIFLRVEHKI